MVTIIVVMALSLLLMALNGCGFVLRFRERGFMSDCWAFVPFFLLGVFFMCYAASMINEPHYGRTATIRTSQGMPTWTLPT